METQYAVQRGLAARKGGQNRLRKTPDPSERWTLFWKWPNNQFGTFLKRRNALKLSKPKGLEDHGNQLKWMIVDFFPT